MKWYIRFLPGWSGVEIKCTVYVALSKQPLNQFKLDQKSRQQALRAYCPNIYTVPGSDVDKIIDENNRKNKRRVQQIMID